MVKFRIDEAVSQETASELWPLYDSVFGDYADFETWHRSVWAKHSVREGFCLARAYDGDSLVGFAYGYTGARSMVDGQRAAGAGARGGRDLAGRALRTRERWCCRCRQT
jgi:hypothetical protein